MRNILEIAGYMAISGRLKKFLIDIARNKMVNNDRSHDINHALRVLAISEKIAKIEVADLDILVPAAIFHDVVCYPKNHPKRFDSQKESAELAAATLNKIELYPKNKIHKVCDSINICSFTKARIPDLIEDKILQDADSLEAMGAISIMRTFSSAGVMNKNFYNQFDPFCKNRRPDEKEYALDLFFSRLLIVHERLHTKTAKVFSKKRILFLKSFLKALRSELTEDGILYER